MTAKKKKDAEATMTITETVTKIRHIEIPASAVESLVIAHLKEKFGVEIAAFDLTPQCSHSDYDYDTLAFDGYEVDIQTVEKKG